MLYHLVCTEQFGLHPFLYLHKRYESYQNGSQYSPQQLILYTYECLHSRKEHIRIID